MALATKQFNFKLNNIPLMDLRAEFTNAFKLVHKSDFIKIVGQIVDHRNLPVHACFRSPGEFLTFLVQRAVLGIESYLPAATSLELGERRLLTRELRTKLKNPFSLGGRGTVENFYHYLPCAVDPSFSLKNVDASLWLSNREFYTQVRNPIFHGNEFSHIDVESVRTVFMHIAQLYKWIDRWDAQFSLLQSAHKLFKLPIEFENSSSIH